MKYDERTCKFNMDTGCVELLLRDGRMISIDCTGVEDALDVTMAQRSELDYLNPGAVNGNFSPILESQLHTPGIHVKLAGSFIVLHNRILQFSLSAYGL